jgi:hypothetical protein
MIEIEIDTAIGRILPNTKTKKRPSSIIEVASYIQTALKGITLKELSDRLTISTGMINKFLSVFKLPSFIQDLVKQRVIDSVALVYDLSKLDSNDLLELVPLLKENKINSNELKAFLPFRKRYPNQSIVELYNQQINSKNIKVSVIRLDKSTFNGSLTTLNDKIQHFITPAELISTEINNDYLDIKLTKKGELKLRKIAKEGKRTFQTLIQELIK